MLTEKNISLDDNEKQVSGAKNIFFGTLEGIKRGSVNIQVPKFVYHYTTADKFCAILSSETIRLHTIDNFDDKLERQLSVKYEERIKLDFLDNETGKSYDLKEILKNQLSNDHIFILSNSFDGENSYLWRYYGGDGRGVCLRLSIDRFIQYINNKLDDFDIFPDHMKCCQVSYDSKWFDDYLEHVHTSIKKVDSSSLGVNETTCYLIWVFFVEYWRNFLKTESYSLEKELRFVISDNYSLFLELLSLLFNTRKENDLSRRFHDEYEKRKSDLYKNMGFESSEGKRFVKIPLYNILDSITIGPNSTLTKNEISNISQRRIRKSTMTKSFINL